LSGETITKKRFSVTLTSPYLDALDKLVGKGIYVNQQGAIKDGLRHLFRSYGLEPFYTKLVEKNEKHID